MVIDFRYIIGECFVTTGVYSMQILDHVAPKSVLLKVVDRPEKQIWTTLQYIKN